MYRIREVEGADEEDVLTCLHQLTFCDAAKVPSFEEGFWWLAYEDDVAVAFAGMIPSTVYPQCGYFIRVGVLPRCAGGLQLRFMRALERKAKRLGWERIVSDTWIDNVRSANNFIKAGWKLMTPETAWAFQHSLYWSKTL
jgi:hypothetical protein